MKQITRINHVGLRVRELDTAREFYEKLGFEFIVGPIGPEPVAVMEHPTGINLNFILNASRNASEKNLLMDVPEKHTGYTHIALEITDAGEVEKQLADAGYSDHRDRQSARRHAIFLCAGPGRQRHRISQARLMYDGPMPN